MKGALAFVRQNSCQPGFADSIIVLLAPLANQLLSRCRLRIAEYGFNFTSVRAGVPEARIGTPSRRLLEARGEHREQVLADICQLINGIEPSSKTFPK